MAILVTELVDPLEVDLAEELGRHISLHAGDITI